MNNRQVASRMIVRLQRNNLEGSRVYKLLACQYDQDLLWAKGKLNEALSLAIPIYNKLGRKVRDSSKKHIMNTKVNISRKKKDMEEKRYEIVDGKVVVVD